MKIRTNVCSPTNSLTHSKNENVLHKDSYTCQILRIFRRPREGREICTVTQMKVFVDISGYCMSRRVSLSA